MPDQRRQEFVLPFDDATGDVVFPTPGIARIVIEYQDDVLGVVRSSAALVEIAAPQGAELTGPGQRKRSGWAIGQRGDVF